MSLPVSTRRVLLTSLLVDLLDIGINLVVTLITSSAVIFAEFLQGVTDFTGSLFLVIGRNQAGRPKDYRHPFGYARDVFFWSLTSSFIMLFVGASLSIIRGYRQIMSPEIIKHEQIALGVLLVSVMTNGYALSLGIRRLRIEGRNILHSFFESSQQLVKTAVIRDLLGTLAAIVGLASLIFYKATGLISFDGLGAVEVGVLMAFFALVLINQSRHLLVGHSVPRKVVHRIRRSIIKIAEVTDIKRLIAVYIGNDQILVDLEVELIERLNTSQVEKVLDQIKETIIQDVPETQSVQIDISSAKLKEEVRIEKV